MRARLKRHVAAWQQRRLAAERRTRAAESRRTRARGKLARLLLGSAIIVLAAGALTVVLEIRFLANARRTVGDVVGLQRETWIEYSADRSGLHHQERSRVVHAAVVFRSDDGRHGRIETVDVSGNNAPVLYLPDHPEVAQLDDWFSKWLGQTVLLLVGLGLLVAWRGVQRRLEEQ